MSEFYKFYIKNTEKKALQIKIQKQFTKNKKYSYMAAYVKD